MTGTAPLPDTGSNRDLLDHLRRQAQLDPDGGWELHVHPDLWERLAALAGSPRAVVALYGLAGVVVKGVAAVVALGTSTLLVRLPEPPDGDGLVPSGPVEPLTRRGWYSVHAWSSDPARLADLVRAAREHAARAG
jgi:hypothetical protein